jgi:hypothetical protein
MPQPAHKAFEAKKLISASMPSNISAEDKAKLEADWAEKARLRNEAVSRETAIPKEASLILKYELHKFGRHWMAYSRNGRQLKPLLLGPSLFTSAMDAISDKMAEEASKS